MHFEGIDDILQVALQYLRKGMAGKADTVVGHARLRVVVGTDFCAPVSGCDHRTAQIGPLLLLFGKLDVIEFCSEHLHGSLLVLEL